MWLWYAQREHDVEMASYWRQCDVVTSHWCRCDNVLAPGARWVSIFFVNKMLRAQENFLVNLTDLICIIMIIKMLKGVTVHDNTEKCDWSSWPVQVILFSKIYVMRARWQGNGRFVYLLRSVKLYIMCVFFPLNCRLLYNSCLFLLCTLLVYHVCCVLSFI